MQRRLVGLAPVLFVTGALLQSCSTQTYLGPGMDPDAGSPSSFTPASDGGDAQVDGDATLAMCPSSQCRAPFATCSTSTYLCDVDLSNDSNNCGACGRQCPNEPWRNDELHAKWVCVKGECKMSCSTSHYEDCNGRIEDGCETIMNTISSCGTCGSRCPENTICNGGVCLGCKPGEVYCADHCANLDASDNDCGACKNACPSQPPDRPAAPVHMYYGCQARTCGNLKCESGWANCNGDADDGCEIWTGNDTKNCGQCGHACAAGEVCRDGSCQCDTGPTGCDCLPDFDSDLMNCGACGTICDERPNSTPICEFGRCGRKCKSGYGDCNRDPMDGCEVDLEKDPAHCGACGTECETGQACIGGVCAMEPCPPGVTR